MATNFPLLVGYVLWLQHPLLADVLFTFCLFPPGVWQDKATLVANEEFKFMFKFNFCGLKQF